MAELPTDPDALVRTFCAAFGRLEVDELLDFFAEEAVYHNIPLEPAVGRDAIRAVIEMFVGMASEMSFFSSTGSTYSALTRSKTAASCCTSSSGSGASELRATACSCIVVSAPATAPTARRPATFNFEPMVNVPFTRDDRS